MVHPAGLSYEKALREEAKRLDLRIALAEDLGAAVLGIDENPYESPETLDTFVHRLYNEQPDLFGQIRRLQGRRCSIIIDRLISTQSTD